MVQSSRLRGAVGNEAAEALHIGRRDFDHLIVERFGSGRAVSAKVSTEALHPDDLSGTGRLQPLGCRLMSLEFRHRISVSPLVLVQTRTTTGRSTPVACKQSKRL